MQMSKIQLFQQKVFNTTKHEGVVARSSNPFAKTSFKGNVLSADVFESTTKAAQTTLGKNKLTMSALVGSISDFGSKFKAGYESVIAFGGRMKEGVTNTWNKLNSIEISFEGAGQAISSKVSSMFENNSAKALSKRPVSELRTMLTDAIATHSSVVA